jgi:hypothetical protein
MEPKLAQLPPNLEDLFKIAAHNGDPLLLKAYWEIGKNDFIGTTYRNAMVSAVQNKHGDIVEMVDVLSANTMSTEQCADVFETSVYIGDLAIIHLVHRLYANILTPDQYGRALRTAVINGDNMALEAIKLMSGDQIQPAYWIYALTEAHQQGHQETIYRLRDLAPQGTFDTLEPFLSNALQNPIPNTPPPSTKPRFWKWLKSKVA